MSASSKIREGLDHPVVDGDGHWIEPVPVFLEYLRDEGGPAAIDGFLRFYGKRSDWYDRRADERSRLRLCRRSWWDLPAATLDRATVMLPALFSERLDEMGIDFSIVYPSLGIILRNIRDADVRNAAIRALNRMTSEIFAPFSDRMTPVATVSVKTPDEAIEQTRHAVSEIGMRAIMTSGSVMRRIEVEGETRYFVDTLGLDSPFDYDPFWAVCQELGVAVTDHGGSNDWPDRQSPTNFVFNHLGHFASQLHASCRGLFLGGVTRRYPDLQFAFLEGGVGWACNLLLDLMGHWEKRNTTALNANVRPTNIDERELRRLFERYASGPLRGRFDEIYNSISVSSPFMNPEELTSLEGTDGFDDFEHVQVSSAQELADEFRRNFYFGCEPDDLMTAIAFNKTMDLRLHPIFSSDVGHFDVVSVEDVLHEAYELVDDGLIDEHQFEEFTFTNVVSLHTRMNPSFFEGTVVERAAADHVNDHRKRHDQ